jgi:hypothetical protein
MTAAELVLQLKESDELALYFKDRVGGSAHIPRSVTRSLDAVRTGLAGGGYKP